MQNSIEKNADILPIDEELLRNEILKQTESESITKELALISQEGPIERQTLEDFLTADYKFEVLRTEIEEFQDKLSDEYDVVLAMASFGNDMVLQVTEIGYHNPDMLFFYGNVDGNSVQLIQHMSQLNFMLMAMKKEDPEKEPNRIGFNVGKKKV